MPYTPVHAPNWKDYPDTTTPEDAAWLNQLEAALVKMAYGPDGAVNEVPIYDGAGGWTHAKVADAQVAAAAAISYSKLNLANSIVNADIASAAAIAYSKLNLATSIVNADVATAAAIGISKLAGYPTDGTKALFGDGTWKVPSGASTPAVTAALPGSPTNGDEIILVDSTTAPTYAWHLHYISAKSSNKWQFVGGSPIISEVTASESTASLSYTALTTAGPSVALPVAGDYIITIGFQGVASAANVGGYMSYDIGGTGAVDADGNHEKTTGSLITHVLRTYKKTGLTAVTLTAKYKNVDTAGTFTFAYRVLSVLPIALGG